MSALLDTSVKHAPHVDWVVAHIGSCFPHTVIRRVLAVGLEEFVTTQEQGGNRNPKPKMMSVVSILTHLATTHSTEVWTKNT